MNSKLNFLFAALLAISPMAVQAAPMAIDFTVAGGGVSGSGTAYTDSSNLDPGDSTTNPALLTGMTMSLSGIPGVPTTTSFTKVDLNDIEWFLVVNGAGTIIDLNFFMRNDGTNADGYSIEGFTTFNFHLCQGAAVSNLCVGDTLANLVVSVTDVHAVAVPEPMSVALLGLGLAGLGFSRRRKA